MIKLSVVLATRNEEDNIERCLSSVSGLADEIVVFDEYSNDTTRDIAKSFGAKVTLEPHHEVFHITKQKAIDSARGEWILQLDADEVLSPELSREIAEVIKMSDNEIVSRKPKDETKTRLFKRHQQILSSRDGKLGTEGITAAFFIPRRNMFLGKPLVHAGVYPDAVVRLFRKGHAYLPGKSVHEQMVIKGRVDWLFNDLLHYDSPTLFRYFIRLNRYTDLQSTQFASAHVSDNIFGFIKYVVIMPFVVFVKLYLRHKGFMDGLRGFMWSALSASHFPIAYFKYVTK